MMKTAFKTLALFIMCCTSRAAYSQATAETRTDHDAAYWYLNAGVGYNFPAARQVIAVDNNASNAENVYGSYGSGLDVGVGIGYSFSGHHISGELNFNYLIGKEYDFHDNFSNGNIDNTTASANMLRIIPAVKISTATPPTSLYAKFGAVIGVAGKITVDGTRTFGNNDYVTTHEELSGGAAVGWTASLGADFEMSSNLSIFAELTGISLSYAPAEDDWNATGTAGNLVITESGTTKFEDNVSSQPTSNLGIPFVDLKSYWPFSSFGLRAGVKLDF